MVNIPEPAYRDALKTNKIYYYTGKPCKYGHFSKRLTKNRSCIECSYEKTRLWRDKHRSYVREYSSKYHKVNPEIKRLSEAKRNALKKSIGGIFTREDLAQLTTKQNNLCNICNCDLSVSGYHIDHIIPLSKGGANWPENIQLLCPTDNLRKNNLPDAIYRQKILNANS